MCDFDYDGDGDIDFLDDALLLEEELYNAKINEVNRLYRQGYSIDEIYEKIHHALDKHQIKMECEHAAWEMAREKEKRRKKQTPEKKYTFAESMKLLKDLFFNRN